MRLPLFCLACAVILGSVSEAAASFVSSELKPPAPGREFRGAWVATVGNINWPSKPGLPTAQQQAELRAIFDRAVQLRLNAIVFQVRPACDAVYISKLEPWSEYLTGVMGRAPRPGYDPLAFAVHEAHQRGLQLHAWFNPFRARYNRQVSPPSSDHVSRRRPQLVRTYGAYQWLDPGDQAVAEYSLKVILDVVQRYDIDGVHLDDYFYPYPEVDGKRNPIDFPDATTYSRYRSGGGKLAKEDWRRDNVNLFLKRTYDAIKAEKKHVQFGVSPFGIWRPGFPSQVRGFDAYDRLYADSRKWLMEGCLDYLAPQLYWTIDAPGQSFPVLLQWWAAQNRSGRHLWPGLSVYGPEGKRAATEVVNQVRLTRKQEGVEGLVFWSMGPLMQNRGGVVDALQREVFSQPALSPALPWLDSIPPAQPKAKAGVRIASGSFRISWTAEGGERPWLWLVQIKDGAGWKSEVLPGSHRTHTLPRSAKPEAVSVTAVDRCGNLSAPAVLQAAAD